MAKYLGRKHAAIKAAGRSAKVVFVNHSSTVECLFEDAQIVRHFFPTLVDYTEIKGSTAADIVPTSRIKLKDVQNVANELNSKGYSVAVVETGVCLGYNPKDGCTNVCMFYFPATGKLVPFAKPAKPAVDDDESWMLIGEEPEDKEDINDLL
jgi:hypothetical protein